jgi:hypothetical protein
MSSLRALVSQPRQNCSLLWRTGTRFGKDSLAAIMDRSLSLFDFVKSRCNVALLDING